MIQEMRPDISFGKVTVSTGYSSLDTTIVLSSGQGAKLPDSSVSGSFRSTINTVNIAGGENH